MARVGWQGRCPKHTRQNAAGALRGRPPRLSAHPCATSSFSFGSLLRGEWALGLHTTPPAARLPPGDAVPCPH